jgi:outer membrane lipoprotein carrier protein
MRMNSFDKKIVFRLALPVFFVLALSPARLACAAGSSPMLGEILKNTEAQYKQMHAFTAYFTQVTTSSAAGTITPSEATGRLYYARPRQMRWDYDKPEVQVFAANGDYAWLYVPAEKQVSLFDARSLFASPLAQTFFDGAVSLKKHFEVGLDAARSGKVSAVLKLVPKQEDPTIKTLFLWIDLQTYRILKIESIDLLGNTNRIVLDSLSVVPQLDPKLFQFEVPQAASVFDADGRQLSPAEIEELKAKTSPR